ncbi:hypothetical protein, partial [Xanthomonas fragariae]
MRNDLQRWHCLEKMPIQRHHTPHHEGRCGDQQPTTRLDRRDRTHPRPGEGDHQHAAAQHLSGGVLVVAFA